MKRAVVVVASATAEWCGAFADGLRRHGWRADLVADLERPADMAVFWGVRRAPAIALQRAAGGEVCILERAYLGDRFAWTSVSFGGRLNGRAEFRSARDDPARLDRHFPGLLRPWRREGGYALLIGQVPGDMALAPVNGSLTGWYGRTAARLRRLGYDVRFRPHPLSPLRGREGRGFRSAPADLRAAIAGAALVVTFNSNAGVDAVVAGTPAMAADRGSMAWPVTTHRADEEPIRPDRRAWAARLAWCQWSLDEMRSGECWARQSP